jgi:hypothetical protein
MLNTENLIGKVERQGSRFFVSYSNRVKNDDGSTTCTFHKATIKNSTPEFLKAIKGRTTFFNLVSKFAHLTGKYVYDGYYNEAKNEVEVVVWEKFLYNYGLSSKSDLRPRHEGKFVKLSTDSKKPKDGSYITFTISNKEAVILND